MKKLLLVLLVPVMVLGLMVSCGPMDGETNPISLQGVWLPVNAQDNDIGFILSANQATVFKVYNTSGDVQLSMSTYGNIAYRTDYSGPDAFGLVDPTTFRAGSGDATAIGIGPGREFKLTFNWFEGSNDEIGKITAWFLLGSQLSEDLDMGTATAIYADIVTAMIPLKTAPAAYTAIKPEYAPTAADECGTPNNDLIIIYESKPSFKYMNVMMPPTGIYYRMGGLQ